MRLSTFAEPGVRLIGDPAVTLSGIAADSRTVAPGDLFAALAGTRGDGLDHADEALARGAVAILGDARLTARRWPVPVLVAEDPRRALARLAARFFAGQPETVVAVTGTNGKTSVASFVRQLWLTAGHKAASIGTLGVQSSSGDRPGALTTPDPVTLHRLAAELQAEGIEHLAVEASSHGLDQRRLDGLAIKAAAFTNLSRDHFDYHGSPEAYLAAKARLFEAVLPPGGAAVLNADVPEFPLLAGIARARGQEILDYGRGGTRLGLVAQTPHARGQRLELVVDGRAATVESGLVGAFQAWNLLAALGLALATGVEREVALAGLGRVVGAAGRMQLVGLSAQGAPVYVDYAHTPDALEKVLRALRPHAPGRLWVVFGCGGDRDPGKRPLMGAVAARCADRVVVTDDNPRGEDPAAIRSAILAACPGALEIGDRAQAIARAVGALERGDLLVVAGKGHETGQIVAGTVLPFDDREVVRAVLARPAGAAA